MLKARPFLGAVPAVLRHGGRGGLPTRSASFSSSAAQAPRDLDRTGVFFSVDQFPVTGRPANQRSTPEQLRARVASWRTEYRPLGALTEAQHTQFFDQGWVIMHDVVPHDVLQAAVKSVEALVDEVAERLYAMGKITDLCKDSDFHTRLIRLDEQYTHTNVLLHKNGLLPKGIQDVWSHPNLMAIATQILGEGQDIVGHPVWNLRCKTPEKLSSGQATVPWHQDNSYLDEECWDKLQVTAWVPLLDATVENGCMQVVRGGHLSGVTANHACCVGGTWYTEVLPEEIEATLGCDMKNDIVDCEVPFGSVLLLNNLIPHRSLPNYSKGVRWSLDLRWQRGGEPNGFHGLKDSCLMKRGNLPISAFDGTVDWGSWAQEDRTVAQHQSLTDKQRELVQAAGVSEGRYNAEEPELDTTIVGPWMHKWDMIHHNRHTAKLEEQ